MSSGRIAGVVVWFLVGAWSAGAELRSGLPEPAAELRTGRWPARWITHPQAPMAEYGVFLFRREFELAARPARFVVHVTGDARYRLWVNGEPACFGPQWSDAMDWRYETVDLAPWLREGKNVIAAQVRGYGEGGPYANMGKRTGFLLQGDGAAERGVNSGEGWKTSAATGYAPFLADQAELRTFLVVGPGDRLDGAAHPWGWEGTDFDQSAWSTARVLGPGQPRGWGTDMNMWLSPRSTPLMEEVPERLGRMVRAEGVVVPERFVAGGVGFTVPARTKASVLFDQGVLTNAFPQLTVSGGKGAEITLRYAEALVDAQGQKGHRDALEGRRLLGLGDRFRPDGGRARRFAPMDFRTYRYVQLDIVTGDEPLLVEDLHGVFTGYPFKENASFRSGDPTLAKIWEVGWRTARLCALETYVDCPYYEQLQYVGDTRIQALISLYVSGDDRLMRNAIELFDRSRTPEGLTQSRYPSRVPQIINTFSLFWIDMVHDHWRHRGDRELVRAHLPAVQGVLAWFAARVDPETGLLGPLPYWTFVDWAKEWPWDNAAGIGGEPPGTRTGGSSIVTLQYVGTLRRAADLCRLEGQEALAAEYEAAAGRLCAAVNRHCWDESRRLYADTPERRSFSQHANINAVLAGAIEGERARELIKRVADDAALIEATTYFRFYLLRAMRQAGRGDEYLARLGPWHEMLARGLTTFAEKPDPTRSDCHAWSASPVYELLATVAGIEPAAPGFATVRIEPHPGHLRDFKARMPHPAGEIALELRQVGATGVEAKITLPAGVTGKFLWKGKSVELREGEQEIGLGDED